MRDRFVQEPSHKSDMGDRFAQEADAGYRFEQEPYTRDRSAQESYMGHIQHPHRNLTPTFSSHVFLANSFIRE